MLLTSDARSAILAGDPTTNCYTDGTLNFEFQVFFFTQTCQTLVLVYLAITILSILTALWASTCFPFELNLLLLLLGVSSDECTRGHLYLQTHSVITFISSIITSATLCNAHGQCDQYLQKLGMGVYDNENQLGVSKKKNPNLGKKHFSTHRLEVKYAVGKQILMQ